MVIVHLISGLSGGGAEHFLLNLCKESKKHNGVKMIVISITSINTLAFAFRKESIAFHFLDIDKNYGNWFSGVYRLNKILKSYREASVVLHAHMFHACILACLLKIVHLNIPIIFTLHNTYIKELNRRWFLYLCRPLRSKDIIFPGFKRLFFQRAQSIPIPYGIETAEFYHETLKPNIFTCLFVGRLVEQKNPLYLIELVKKLQHKYVFKIVIAGDGELRKELEELIEFHNLQAYFDIQGYRASMSQLFAKSHCLLLPSSWEGMPMVLLEAGASCLPVVSTPVGNITKFLDISTAYISDIEEFHVELEKLINNYDVAQLKAKKFYSIICNSYTMEKTFLDHLHQVYLPAINRPALQVLEDVIF